MRNIIYVSLNYAIGMVFIANSIIVARSLGLEGFGAYQILFAFFGSLILYLSPNFEEVVIKITVFQKKPPFLLLFIFELCYRIIISIILSVNADKVIHLFGVTEYSSNAEVIFMALMLVPPISVLEGYIRSNHHERWQTFLKGLCNLGLLFALFYVSKEDNLNLTLAVIMTIMARGIEKILQICMILIIYNYNTKLVLLTESFSHCLSQAIWSGLSLTVSFPIKSITLIAALFFPVSVVGLIKLADNLASLAYQAATSVYKLKLPSIIADVKKSPTTNHDPLFLVVGGIGLVIGVMLYWVVPILYGIEFSEAIPFFWILVSGYVASSTLYKAPGKSLANNSFRDIVILRACFLMMFIFVVFIFSSESAFYFVATVAFFKYALMVGLYQQYKWSIK